MTKRFLNYYLPLFLLVALITTAGFFVYTQPAKAAFGFVQSDINTSAGDLTTALTGVGAGNLIVAWAKWEGSSGGTGITSISDGTNTFALATLRNNGTDMHAQFAYLLSSTSGNKTYTIDINGTEGFVDWMVAEYSYTGTASLDTQAVNSSDSTSLTSGNITLAGTGTGLVVGGGAMYLNTTYTNRNINNTAATNTVTGWRYASLWSSAIDSGTLDADATSSASTLWVCNIIAFKATSPNGSSTRVYILRSGDIILTGRFILP